MKRPLLLACATLSLASFPASQTGGAVDPPKLFFTDPNQRGTAPTLHLEELFWGRLVDVHALRADGSVTEEPLLRDLVINENIQSDGFDYLLETSPLTQATRLVVLRRAFTAPFFQLVQQAQLGLVPIVPKNDDGTEVPPFSQVARNGAIVARFDDLLKADEDAVTALPETVKILTGYPPTAPFTARIFFPRTHGGVVNGNFHPTRVVIDFAVSELEAANAVTPLPVNLLGLPSSDPADSDPNVSVRIPTRIDFGAGQFVLLTNLANSALDPNDNGPADLTSPTQDVVRAMRSGNSLDLNNGFQLDLEPPQLLGTWPIAITEATEVPGGEHGLDFFFDYDFTSSCSSAAEIGDIVQVGVNFLEVRDPGTFDGVSVEGAQMRVLGDPVVLDILPGPGLFQSTYDPGIVPGACWVSFAPQPGIFPDADVSPASQVLARFSEPILPETVSAFDTFRLVRGDSSVPVDATNLVVGEVLQSVDLTTLVHTPLVPLKHARRKADPYHAQLLDGLTDLAGNGIAVELLADFLLDPLATEERNAGFALRFEAVDEFQVGAAAGAPDLRGQFFYDLDEGAIRPRPTTFFSAAVDETNPIPSLMIPLGAPIQTPLSPLGSKLHQVWRYADLGWQVEDETKFNVDVVGLNWRPFGGTPVADFYDEFEIRLAHASKLPDEQINNFLLPEYPLSGLFGAPNFYTDNILDDPESPQKVVHPRQLGYAINPVDLFAGVSGALLMPFPLNQNASVPTQTYTWRDTGVQAVAGASGAGVPLDVEVGPPLFLDPGPAGRVAPAGEVPSFGLPLLIEFRCFPTDTGVGLNGFEASLAINSSARPHFRAYSTGGIDVSGSPVAKNPDLELVPSGGFNPASVPPGQPTRTTADPFFYEGQLDLVVRISRVHTIWFDTESGAPEYFTPVLEPQASEQPLGTQVVVEFRGAGGFPMAGTAPFDASRIDPYGAPDDGGIRFHRGVSTWTEDVTEVDGARYLQMRFTFVNDLSSGANAELDSVGIAYTGFPPRIQTAPRLR